MQTDELISVREYLTTSYDPDCDNVDGVVEERNAGETDYSALQMAVAAYFYERRKEWGVTVLPEQRVQVSERVKDYLQFGVPYIFLLDPMTRKAYRCTAEGMFEVSELHTENPETVVPLEALFE